MCRGNILPGAMVSPQYFGVSTPMPLNCLFYALVRPLSARQTKNAWCNANLAESSDSS